MSKQAISRHGHSPLYVARGCPSCSALPLLPTPLSLSSCNCKPVGSTRWAQTHANNISYCVSNRWNCRRAPQRQPQPLLPLPSALLPLVRATCAQWLAGAGSQSMSKCCPGCLPYNKVNCAARARHRPQSARLASPCPSSSLLPPL